MNNNPELDGKYIGTITKDFAAVSDKLKEASYLIRKNGFSEYPVFPMCKADQPIGQLLIDKKESDIEWNVYASFLDELEQRQFVTDVDSFTKTYKNVDEFCCLLIIDNQFTNFVFLPYPDED